MNEHIKIWTEPSSAGRMVGRIRLDRPRALHAMYMGMVRAINDALSHWSDDDSIAFVLVDHAPGSSGFCAGGDIRALAAAETAQIVSSFIAEECTLAAQIHSFPKPYVAIMDGVVMGAGLGLAIHGSHRVATDNTKLAMPEVGIGLFPDTGVAWHLARLPDQIGVWMAMTGVRLTGREATDLALATHFVPSEHIDGVKKAIIADGPGALDRYMSAPSGGDGFPGQHRARIKACFAAHDANAIVSALRESGDAWAIKQADIIGDKCPTSVKLALRYLRGAAGGDDFRAMMRTEYGLVCAMANRPDFREGVRAVIIDKDNAPQWSPARLEDTMNDSIEALFALTPDDAFSLADV